MNTVYKKLVAGMVTFAFIAMALPTQTYALGQTIQPRNLGQAITGVGSASTTALDINLATLLSGENTTFNRMMVTPAYTCFATTTDTLVKTGSGILGSSFIASHSSDVTLSFYDATTTGTVATKIADDFTLSASNGTQKVWGASFSTGLYLDITGTGTSTICYL